MNTYKYIFAIICLMISGSPIIGQNFLSIDEAVQQTLNNNYNIKISKNDIQVAVNNTNKSLFGYKPIFAGSAGLNGSNGVNNLKFANGMEQPAEGFSWGPSASVSVNYTLFDKERDMNLEQVKENLNLTNLFLRQNIENNLLQVYNSYFEIARLAENLNALAETINVSRKRLQRAEYQREYGQGIRLDISNAEVDIKRDSVNYLNLRQQLQNAKRNLNVTLGRDINADFYVDTNVVYDQSLTLESILESAKENNVNLLIINKNQDISKWDLEIINASGKPTLGASASYDYSLTKYGSSSFLTERINRGLNLGLNFNWTLPAAGSQDIRRQNNQIAMASQDFEREQAWLEIQRDITNAWQNYQNALYILEVESSNLETNKLNFAWTEEQFKTGLVNSVEFRQAQLNLLTATTNFSIAKYDAKVIEYQLLQLSGQIMQ